MKKILVVLMGVLLTFSIAGSASATLIGDTVDLTFTYKGSAASPVVTNDATDAVNFNSVLKVDLNDDDVTVTFLKNWTGYELKIEDLDDFDNPSGTSVLSVTSAFSGISSGADWVTFSFLGGTFLTGSTITADLIFSLPSGGEVTSGNTMLNPIPAPILLLGTGLVGIAGFRRRIKK